MIIDAHNHPDWLGYPYEKFIADMDANGIDVTWLLPWECPIDEYEPSTAAVTPTYGAYGPIALADCLPYIEKSPERFVLGYAPDLRRPEALDRLKAAVLIHGARVCGEVKLRMMYDNPDALRIFRYCGDNGLPVVLHFDYEIEKTSRYPRSNWWYGGDIDTLERMLQKCPDTVFLGHAPGFWAHIAHGYTPGMGYYPDAPYTEPGRIWALLDAYPNLSCDLSGFSGRNALQRSPDMARRFLTDYQDRALYARDNFDGELRELLDSLGLSAAVLDKLYHANAERLIR